MESQTRFASGLNIYQQEEWAERFFERGKNMVESCGNKDFSTCTAPCVTSLINSYVRGWVYPFINIPIRLNDQELLGLYEFCEQLPLSDTHIYRDFVIHAIYCAEKRPADGLKMLEERTRKMIESAGYPVISFEDGMASIKINRRWLRQEAEIESLLKDWLDLAVRVQTAGEQGGVGQ